MKKMSIAIASILIVLLSGCSVKNNFDVSFPSNFQVLQKNYKLSAVNAQLASENKKTGDLDVFDPEYTQKFEISLLKALKDTKLFDDTSHSSLQIKAVILQNDTPSLGLNMTVYTDILYEIKNQEGKVLYSKSIQAEGLATIGDEFVAFKRMVLANDRSVQNNIKLFIDDIKSKKF